MTDPHTPVYESPFCDGPNAHPDRDDTAHLPALRAARFQTRQQSVEAIRFVRRDLDSVLAFVGRDSGYNLGRLSQNCFGSVQIPAHVPGREPLRFAPGEWLVRLPDGELRVLSDADFAERYSAAPDGEPEVWATRYGDLYRADPDGVWMWNLAGRIDGRLSGGEENPHAAGRRDDIEREAGPLVPVALPPYIPDPEDTE